MEASLSFLGGGLGQGSVASKPWPRLLYSRGLALALVYARLFGLAANASTLLESRTMSEMNESFGARQPFHQ